MNKEQLNKLKAKLPNGWSKRLADELGVTQTTVTNALNGKYYRLDIIERAIQLAQETLAIQKSLEEAIDELS